MQQLPLNEFRLKFDDLSQWPILESINSLDEKIELELTVSKELVFFAGHFPDQPVLPGVVQIHWAGKFSQLLFKPSGFRSLNSVKFINVVLPDSQLQLQLNYIDNKNKLEFVYYSEGVKISSGTFTYDDVAG